MSCREAPARRAAVAGEDGSSRPQARVSSRRVRRVIRVLRERPADLVRESTKRRMMVTNGPCAEAWELPSEVAPAAHGDGCMETSEKFEGISEKALRPSDGRVLMQTRPRRSLTSSSAISGRTFRTSMDTDTNSTPDDSLIDVDDPLGMTGSPTESQLRHRELRARVDQACAEVCSSSPLYQARAAKDPNYWKNFSVGGVSMP